MFSEWAVAQKFPTEWYQWYYDSQLELLLFMPREIPKSVTVLWLKILQACHLNLWAMMFSGELVVEQSIQTATMILSVSGLQKILSYFQPKYVWFIIESCYDDVLENVITTEIILTEDVHQWTVDARIKKQIWLNWLKILGA